MVAPLAATLVKSEFYFLVTENLKRVLKETPA